MRGHRYTLYRKAGRNLQFVGTDGVMGDIHRAQTWPCSKSAVEFAKLYKLAGWSVVRLEYRLTVPLNGAIHIHESMIEQPEQRLQAVQ